MSTKDTIKYLNCSESLLRKLIRESKIEYFRMGNKICFEKSKLDNWVSSQYKAFK